jgi:hypothetical protein
MVSMARQYCGAGYAAAPSAREISGVATLPVALRAPARPMAAKRSHDDRRRRMSFERSPVR